MNSANGPLWFFLYIFLLKFGIYVISKRSKEENGRPTTAKPLVGRPAMAWPPARGQPAVAKTPCKGATGCGQGPLHKGLPAVASPQGRQAPAGTTAYS
ncbi:hypothetical protein B296_00017905, partial [Ensete ventricosum]